MNTTERFSPAERKALEFARDSPFYEELFEAFLRLQEDHFLISKCVCIEQNRHKNRTESS